MAYCTNCGKELPAGSAVCPSCGKAAEGKITFFRQGSFAAKAIKTEIIIDGRSEGKLGEKETLSVSLPYGTHSVIFKAPLAPTYKASVVIDDSNLIVHCTFAINMRSGRPEPISVEAQEKKKGVTYLQPGKPNTKRERIVLIIYSLVFFALMAFADWNANGRILNIWTALLLLDAVVIAVLTILKHTKTARSPSTAQEKTGKSPTKKEEKEIEKKPKAEKPEPLSVPIYEIIKQNLRDGELPSGFSIEGADDRSGAVRFAPGAMDGMLLYPPCAAADVGRGQLEKSNSGPGFFHSAGAQGVHGEAVSCHQQRLL